MSNNLDATRILEVITELGIDFQEKARTIYATCPKCGLADKLSILKNGGKTICFRGSCDFKGPRSFVEFVMMTADISKQEAINMVYGGERRLDHSKSFGLHLKKDGEIAPTPQEEPLVPILYPSPFDIPLSSLEALPGCNYLMTRGINTLIASHYSLMYSTNRRVVIPVIMNHMCYGWQARAIDPVDPGDRMRNNPGFQRAKCVMFLDRISPGSPAIIAEGPFDALKFHLCGGNVCTMGKFVSKAQLDLIFSKKPSAVYLALDDDAAPEARALQKKIPIPLYRIEVPESARQRCAAQGRKADFGECTMEECLTAFRSAEPFHMGRIKLYLKA